ncbi:MAG TPA: Rv2175c family DNA-binding protein [Dermatophilaceae bacterium]|nr:Rv2175c family DNA-binding protein [Dermatophilaceae bacterium]
MSDAAAPATGGEAGGDDLHELVGDWSTLPDLAERLGVPVGRVRRMVQDRLLLAIRTGPRGVWQVPVAFLTEPGVDPVQPRPELRGTFTVLADGGMDDTEIIRWLFTPDPTLPAGGTPMDALRGGHKTEIRRRAMELAF